MKRIITYLLTLLFLSFYANAQQVPNGFNYQSIARDGMGLPIVNSQINLRITVRQNSISGTDVWQETQSATTNQFGLINLVIGNGTKTGGLASITGISGIDWASDKFFIIVEVNNGGSYVSLGITQFQSVPYALAADNALKIQGSKVGAIIPTANQFLKFNAISGQWEPGNISGANGGTVVSVGGIGPITITGTAGLDPQIGILKSSAIQDGYLSSLDWAGFSNKLGTTTGFGGNVIGTYDAITVIGIQNVPVAAIVPTNGQVLIYDGIQWVPTTTGASVSVITVTGSGEISVTPGSSPIISVSTASGISNGIISMADYISFSNKLSVNSLAGGDLSGPYNNLLINSIGGIPISLALAPAGSVLSFNGTGFVPALLSSAVNISSTTPGVSASGTVIDIATADGVTMGLLAPSDYNRFGNKVGLGTTLTGGDVAGSYQDGFTVTGLGTKNLNITGILPGQVLSFNGTSFVPGTPATNQLTSVTGINGIIVGGSGTLYSVDGSNLITVTTVFGGDLNGTYNAITVNRIQSVPFSMAGISNGQYLYYNGTSIVGANIPSATVPTITGINGITLNTNTGYDFTISGQALATYSGDNLLTTLTGTFPNFTIAGISQAQNATTLTGTNGVSVVGLGFSKTIVGQSFIGANGIVISLTGNTFTISNTTPGLSLFGDNVNTSVVGLNNNYTVLGIGSSSQWITTTSGIYTKYPVSIQNPLVIQLTTATGSVAFLESFDPTGSTLQIYNGTNNGSRIQLDDSQKSFTIENKLSVVGFNFSNANNFFKYDAISSIIGINPGGGVVNIGKSGVASNLSVTGVTYTNGLKFNNLASGILTVDGFGNVTTSSQSFASSQWVTTTTAFNSGIAYTNSFVGIGSMPSAANDASLFINSNGNANILLQSNNPAITFWDGTSNNDAAIFIDGADNGKLKFASALTIDNLAQRISNTRMTIDPVLGFIGIGTTSPNEQLTVQNNASIAGIGFASGFKVSTLTLTGIGSGILTVDGFGNVTTTSINLNSVFTQSFAGSSFTNDNIVIQGTTTPGVAKLKVRGDLSAGGQVIASQTMNPTGTASTTATGATLYKQRIYIPEGTNSLNASFNAYEFIGTSGSSGNIFIYINGFQVGPAITFSAPSDQNTTMTLTNIPVSGLSGFQNLEIRARAGAPNDGVILQGYTLVIND